MPRFPTVEDLAVLPTCGEMELEIPGVTWPDGSAVTVRLRALDATRQAAVDRAAAAAGVKAGRDYDDMTALVLTVRHGIVHPVLTDDHERIIWSWNAWTLEQIADALETLSRIPARALQAELERLAGVAVPEKPARKTAAARARTGARGGDPAGEPAPDDPGDG